MIVNSCKVHATSPDSLLWSADIKLTGSTMVIPGMGIRITHEPRTPIYINKVIEITWKEVFSPDPYTGEPVWGSYN